MATLPGHNIEEFIQLSELHKAGFHPVILPSSTSMEMSFDMSRLMGTPVMLKKTQGSRFEVCSQSELQELGIMSLDTKLGLIVEDAERVLKRLYPQGELSDDVIVSQLGEGFKPAEFQYLELGNGSIVVSGSSEPMVMWTVIDGLQLLSGSEGLGPNLPSSPEMRAQLESFSVNDTVSTKCVVDSKRSYMQLVNGGYLRKQIVEFLMTIHSIMVSYSLGLSPASSDGSEEEKQKMGTFLNVLTYLFQQLGEILSFVGKITDTETGVEIIIVMCVSDSIGLNYTKTIIYGMIWALMICSWMLKPIRPRIPFAYSAGAQRQEELSYRMAGAAIISAALGIFCNILSPLPMPYAASAISTCISIVLLLMFYGPRVLGRQSYD